MTHAHTIHQEVRLGPTEVGTRAIIAICTCGAVADASRGSHDHDCTGPVRMLSRREVPTALLDVDAERLQHLLTEWGD